MAVFSISHYPSLLVILSSPLAIFTVIAFLDCVRVLSVSWERKAFFFHSYCVRFIQNLQSFTFFTDKLWKSLRFADFFPTFFMTWTIARGITRHWKQIGFAIFVARLSFLVEDEIQCTGVRNFLRSPWPVPFRYKRENPCLRRHVAWITISCIPALVLLSLRKKGREKDMEKTPNIPCLMGWEMMSVTQRCLATVATQQDCDTARWREAAMLANEVVIAGDVWPVTLISLAARTGDTTIPAINSPVCQ